MCASQAVTQAKLDADAARVNAFIASFPSITLMSLVRPASLALFALGIALVVLSIGQDMNREGVSPLFVVGLVISFAGACPRGGFRGEMREAIRVEGGRLGWWTASRARGTPSGSAQARSCRALRRGA